MLGRVWAGQHGPHHTQANLKSQVNGRGSHLNQATTEGTIGDNCLAHRDKQVCVPGGRPRGQSKKTSATPHPPHPLPSPASQPSPPWVFLRHGFWPLPASLGDVFLGMRKRHQGCLAGHQPPMTNQTWCHCLSGPVLSSNFFILPAPVL